MKKEKDELCQIVKSLKTYMDTEKLFGIEELYSEKNSPVFEAKEDSTLDKLRQRALTCKKCVLYKTRTNIVFGEGHPRARLVFLGEAPGRDEDIQGRPFVGRAGNLLTKIIQAMQLDRTEVYICNVLKCRPPNNRNPLEEEVTACRGYLREQLKLINPKVICSLGKYATASLLNIDTPISKLRGNFYDYMGVKVMPTFHPAYLLRNPSAKKIVWADMQKIMKELNCKSE